MRRSNLIAGAAAAAAALGLACLAVAVPAAAASPAITTTGDLPIEVDQTGQYFPAGTSYVTVKAQLEPGTEDYLASWDRVGTTWASPEDATSYLTGGEYAGWQDCRVSSLGGFINAQDDVHDYESFLARFGTGVMVTPSPAPTPTPTESDGFDSGYEPDTDEQDLEPYEQWNLTPDEWRAVEQPCGTPIWDRSQSRSEYDPATGALTSRVPTSVLPAGEHELFVLPVTYDPRDEYGDPIEDCIAQEWWDGEVFVDSCRVQSTGAPLTGKVTVVDPSATPAPTESSAAAAPAHEEENFNWTVVAVVASILFVLGTAAVIGALVYLRRAREEHEAAEAAALRPAPRRDLPQTPGPADAAPSAGAAATADDEPADGDADADDEETTLTGLFRMPPTGTVPVREPRPRVGDVAKRVGAGLSGAAGAAAAKAAGVAGAASAAVAAAKAARAARAEGTEDEYDDTAELPPNAATSDEPQTPGDGGGAAAAEPGDADEDAWIWAPEASESAHGASLPVEPTVVVPAAAPRRAEALSEDPVEDAAADRADMLSVDTVAVDVDTAAAPADPGDASASDGSAHDDDAHGSDTESDHAAADLADTDTRPRDVTPASDDTVALDLPPETVPSTDSSAAPDDEAGVPLFRSSPDAENPVGTDPADGAAGELADQPSTPDAVSDDTVALDVPAHTVTDDTIALDVAADAVTDDTVTDDTVTLDAVDSADSEVPRPSDDVNDRAVDADEETGFAVPPPADRPAKTTSHPGVALNLPVAPTSDAVSSDEVTDRDAVASTHVPDAEEAWSFDDLLLGEHASSTSAEPDSLDAEEPRTENAGALGAASDGERATEDAPEAEAANGEEADAAPAGASDGEEPVDQTAAADTDALSVDTVAVDAADGPGDPDADAPNESRGAPEPPSSGPRGSGPVPPPPIPGL